MKVKFGGRLPIGTDKDLAFALNNIFGEIEKTLNALESRGLNTVGTIVFDDAATGIVLKDTQGTPHYWRVTVSNAGALVVTDLGTTKPTA